MAAHGNCYCIESIVTVVEIISFLLTTKYTKELMGTLAESNRGDGLSIVYKMCTVLLVARPYIDTQSFKLD